VHPGAHYLRLYRRGTLEFTVLGFQAFVLWILRLAGFWDYIADKYGYEGRPQDGHQLLQAVEDVHFQLFIALVLHLAAVTLAIHRIVKLQRSLHTFESTLRRRRSAARVQRARETARLVGTEPRSHSALTAIHTHRHTEEEDDDDPAADGDLNGDARVVARRSLSAPVTVELPPEERKQSSTSLDRAFAHIPKVGEGGATRRVWHRADMSMVMKAPRRVLGLTQDGYDSLRRRLLQHLVARPLDEGMLGVDEDFDFSLYMELVFNDFLHDLTTFPVLAWGIILVAWGVVGIVSGVRTDIGDGIEILIAAISLVSVALMITITGVAQVQLWKLRGSPTTAVRAERAGQACALRRDTSEDLSSGYGEEAKDGGARTSGAHSSRNGVLKTPVPGAEETPAPAGTEFANGSVGEAGALRGSDAALASTPEPPPHNALRHIASDLAGSPGALMATLQHTGSTLQHTASATYRRWWGEKVNIEKYVLTFVIANAYFVTFGLARVLAGVPFYVEPPGGSMPEWLAYVLFFGGYTLTYVCQTLLLPGTVVRIGTLFAVPPWVDRRNEALIRRVLALQAAARRLGGGADPHDVTTLLPQQQERDGSGGGVLLQSSPRSRSEPDESAEYDSGDSSLSLDSEDDDSAGR
jgi:hypothetical protein